MAAMRPVSFYGLRVPPNGLRIDANPGVPASFQITMAALDPTEEVTSGGDAPPRAILKIVRNIFEVMEDESEDDDDDMDDDDIDAIRRRLGIAEDDSDQDSEEMDDDDEEMVNGGPSDPEKQRKAMAEAIAKQLKEEEKAEEMDVLTNGVNGKLNKGKARASDEDDISEDGLSEFVLCTLDPTTHLQHPINVYIDQDEECYFRVIGTHSVHLTGNFVISPSDIRDESEEEDEEDERERLHDLLMGLGGSNEDEEDEDEDDSEEDDLDDLADPRITEVASDEEEAPQLVKTEIKTEPKKKTKNKRAAEEDNEDVLKKVLKEEDKRQNKKLKTNAGQAAPGASQDKKPDVKETKKEKNAKDVKKEEPSLANGKKVQFAEKLEQGPTPSKAPPLGKRTVSGIQIEDKKTGDGPAAKKGDRVAMRYIGKLKDGKVFDANKKGKPFDFKLGSGEVIKGWEIGVAGMKAGSERRIVVPAKLGYGNKSLPGIPPNSDLTFDLKLISIN